MTDRLDVLRLQTKLAQHKLYTGKIDGFVGPRTWGAVFAFSGARGLTADDLGHGATKHFPAFAIDRPLRVAHFIAQTAHETGGYRWLREIWGPTPAQRRYEGRGDLGNSAPGDGKRFMGRGLIQLTGRANYASAARRTGLPLLIQPELVEQPATALWTACLYWQTHNLNMLADTDDTLRLTRVINGGTNGLADRALRTARMKELLL